MIKLIHGDCLEEMPKMEAGSVDLTVTSPPYDNLRTYNDGLVWNESIWKHVIENLFWLTKEGGVVVWVVGDATIDGSETGTSFKQALWAKEIGFRLHDTMIFQKSSPPIIPTVKRYQPNFEYMFIFVKHKIKTFNAIRVPKLYKDNRTKKEWHRKPDGEFVISKRKPTKDKIKENVWHYAVGGGNMTKDKVNHPAPFPEQLAHDHIISWSNEGDTVFDPFLGSGTTGKMSKMLGCNFIGIEKDPDYFAIAQNRIKSAQPALAGL